MESNPTLLPEVEKIRANLSEKMAPHGLEMAFVGEMSGCLYRASDIL
jgi:hypothetical protein